MYDSMVFYRSFYESIKTLPGNEQVAVYDAVFAYAFEGQEPEHLEGVCKAIFTLIKPQIDANIRRKINGAKGGRPSKKTIGYENEKPMVKDEKTIGYENEKPNVNVNVNVNDNVNDNVNSNANDNVNSKNSAKRFDDDERLNEAILQFVDHRKKLRSPMSDRAIELFIKRVKGLAPTVEGQVELINNAILKGWKTVYPDKEPKQMEQRNTSSKLVALEKFYLNGGKNG